MHKKPYFVCLIVETLFFIISLVYIYRLKHLNQLLIDYYQIDDPIKMSVFTANDLLDYNDKIAIKFFIYGVLIVIIAILIPLISQITLKFRFLYEDDELSVTLVNLCSTVLNLILAINVARELSSPIVIAIILVLGAGSIILIHGVEA